MSIVVVEKVYIERRRKGRILSKREGENMTLVALMNASRRSKRRQDTIKSQAFLQGEMPVTLYMELSEKFF